MGKLVFLIQGPKRAARLNLEGPFFVVGRGEAFPIFHDDPTLSREHAAVVDTPDGFRVKDLGSRNGVTVNGERIGRYAEVPFGQGDVLQAGNTRVQLIDVTELERLQQEAKSITVDEEGQTGHQPVLGQEPDLDGGEVTSEMVRPESLDGLRTELALDEDDAGALTLADDEPLTIPDEDVDPQLDLAAEDEEEEEPLSMDLEEDEVLEELEAMHAPELTREEVADLEELPTDSDLQIETILDEAEGQLDLGEDDAEPPEPELE